MRLDSHCCWRWIFKLCCWVTEWVLIEWHDIFVWWVTFLCCDWHFWLWLILAMWVELGTQMISLSLCNTMRIWAWYFKVCRWFSHVVIDPSAKNECPIFTTAILFSFLFFHSYLGVQYPNCVDVYQAAYWNTQNLAGLIFHQKWFHWGIEHLWHNLEHASLWWLIWDSFVRKIRWFLIRWCDLFWD